MTNVLKVYQDVIDDVIAAVREMFLEEGVDEQVLQELKQSWETKLIASKAVDNTSDLEKQAMKKVGELSNGNGFPKATPQQVVKQVVGQVAPNNHIQTQVTQVVETKMVPIQITLPAQPGSHQQRVLTIHVPSIALQDNQLHKVLTGPVITAVMNLPASTASAVLQQHVNTAFNSIAAQGSNVQIGSLINTGTAMTKTVIQNDGSIESDEEVEFTLAVPSCSKAGTNNLKLEKCKSKVHQTDGADETSDEDDDASDDEEPSDDNDDDKDDDEQEMEEGGPEEEPLNSEDDVTDEDPADLFDTENVVVCQYDKITRSRNKWKFHLKDGIMNLNGEDYVFQKASGDAEW